MACFEPSDRVIVPSLPVTPCAAVTGPVSGGQICAQAPLHFDVVAVSGTNHDICAFGRWTPNIGSEYVTMAHVAKCSATNAPTTGWSAQRGGGAQDLPGADGI